MTLCSIHNILGSIIAVEDELSSPIDLIQPQATVTCPLPEADGVLCVGEVGGSRARSKVEWFNASWHISEILTTSLRS